MRPSSKHPYGSPKETDMTTQAPKVAIITGSSRGIGASIAKRFAANGITVIVNYAGRAADADQVVTDITEQGGKAVAIQADVSVPAQVAALFDQAITLFGGVDILVNNAGIIQPGLTLLADTDDSLFDRLVSINLKGTFNTMRVAAKKLRRGGRIVNFSSTVKTLALPSYSGNFEVDGRGEVRSGIDANATESPASPVAATF